MYARLCQAVCNPSERWALIGSATNHRALAKPVVIAGQGGPTFFFEIIICYVVRDLDNAKKPSNVSVCDRETILWIQQSSYLWCRQ